SSAILALQDANSKSKESKPKSRIIGTLVSMGRPSSASQTRLSESNDSLRDFRESLPHLDTIAGGLLLAAPYEPLPPKTGSVPARTRRQPLSNEYPKVFGAEDFNGTLLVFKEVANLPLNHLSATEQEGQFYMVSEFAAKGNVIHYLENDETASVLALIRDSAAAIEYLHVQRGLVHGDIKPTNILVSWDGRALLCDFSTVKANGDDSSANSKPRRSIPYLSPECLVDMQRPRTTETDMWAFGICIAQVGPSAPLAVMIKRAPSPWDNGSLKYPVIRHKVVEKNERPDMPEAMDSAEIAAWAVASLCWERDASRRLTITNALEMLHAIG
ncbi:hypothetical protein FRC01_001592, partial [Tulasnella sp. 417]